MTTEPITLCIAGVFSTAVLPTSNLVEPYLYEHTTVIATVVDVKRQRSLHVLRTIAEARSYEPAHVEAQRLAKYQVQRLQSGLAGANVVGSFAAAQQAVEAFVFSASSAF